MMVVQKKGEEMKKLLLSALLVSMLFGLSACSGAFWGGAGGGTLAAGAGYEVNAKMQKDRIQKDLDEGKITQEEYDIRKNQIERMSVIQ